MGDMSVTNAWRIFTEALPDLSTRLGVALGLWLAFMASLVAGALAGRALSSFPDSYGGRGAALAAFVFLAILVFVRHRLFYSFALSHLATVASSFESNHRSHTSSLLEKARLESNNLFNDVAEFADFDRLLAANLRSCTRMMGGLSTYLQFPGFTGFTAFANLLLRQAAADLCMVLYVYVFRVSKGNPWEALRQGLVLYMQNAIRLTRSAFLYWVLGWGLALILFLVFRAPIRGLFTLFPAEIYGLANLAALGLVVALKFALIDVFASIAFSDLFNSLIGMEVPDPAWERRLTEESDAFKGVKEKSLQRLQFQF
jgi:hypothetical protein